MRKRGFWRPAVIFPVLVAAAALAVASGCGSSNESDKSAGGDKSASGKVKVDGSSTVGPLTKAVAELFREKSPDIRVSVGISGSGGGFEKFCAGETDISDASRPIKDEEKKSCKEAGIRYEELLVANDGITVAVNNENDFVKCLTVDQLEKIWTTKSKVNNWGQIDGAFPSEKLTLYGPGTDSGTFDFFTEAVNGESGVSRSDYTASEDDNVLVQGIEGDRGALGYFGYSYYAQNTDRLKAVAVDGGYGCIEPSPEAIQSHRYKPLARPLYVYISDKALSGSAAVGQFLQFYMDNVDQAARNSGVVPPTEAQRADSQKKLDDIKGSI